MSEAQADLVIDQSKSAIITKSIKSLTDNTNTPVKSTDDLSKSDNESHANIDLKNLSEEERLKLRVKKFGAQTENTKKEIRAQRFGAPNSEKGDASLLEKRAQRFGTAAGTAAEGKVDNDLLEKRAKRFGTAANGASPDGKETNEVLAKRKQRFGETNEIDEKKKLRQERFQNKV